MLVLGAILAVLGLGSLGAGGTALWANGAQHDGGYFTTASEPFSADSYALTSSRLEVSVPQNGPMHLPFDVGSIKFRAESANPGDVFIGIAAQADVDRYLAGVSHSEVAKIGTTPFSAQYREIAGTVAPATPHSQTFWTVSASGPGAQEVSMKLQTGSWAVVVMNADASPRVAVNLQAGFRSDLLLPLGAGLLAAGAVLLLIGVPLIVAGSVGLGRRVQASNSTGAGGPTAGGWPGAGGPTAGGWPGAGGPTAGGWPGAGGPTAGGWQGVGGRAEDVTPAAGVSAVPPGRGADRYPASLYGKLDPEVSRWLWIFKWLLAIPHFIILFGLWLALVVTTIIAWFAILFTGRYPEPLFHFNVGVLRWNWRVAFYAYSALGTDRYPPFTLARTDYPADFDVPYPQRLSRGLVLVKSWLLALPHLLILAAFTGAAWVGWQRGAVWSTDYSSGGGLTLLGLLVFIAGISLLFTNRYPRGLFDLNLGINRWIYRVVTYVALLRDEYPPFRLDQGPLDPNLTPKTPLR